MFSEYGPDGQPIMNNGAIGAELMFELELDDLIKQYLNVSEVPEHLTREQLEKIRSAILEGITSEVDDA